MTTSKTATPDANDTTADPTPLLSKDKVLKNLKAAHAFIGQLVSELEGYGVTDASVDKLVDFAIDKNYGFMTEALHMLNDKDMEPTLTSYTDELKKTEHERRMGLGVRAAFSFDAWKELFKGASATPN